MVSVTQVILIIFGLFIVAIILGVLIALLIDRFYIRRKLLKLIIYNSDKSISGGWGKKLKEMEGDYNLVRYKKGVWFYKPQDIIKVGGYSGIEIYENSFTAIQTPFELLRERKYDKKAVKTDFEYLEKDSKLTTHPGILHLIVNNKFLRELLQQEIRWQDIILIVAAVMILALFVMNIYYLPKILQLLKANQAMLTEIPINTLKLMGKAV